MTLLATVGFIALPLLYLWLLAGIVCSYLAGRKGYGERPGLATGLLLTVLGIVVWLVIPAREGSIWKRHGAFGRPSADDAQA
jgi:hypothetical protein